MRRLAASFVVALCALGSAQAFDTETEAVLSGLKIGKRLPSAAVATLMRASERWCYFEADGQCRWTDIYLDVTSEGARFEIGNAWDDTVDIYFVDEGEFRDDVFICQSGSAWVASVRAMSREDGTPLGGRELDALKQEIAGGLGDQNACFDYILEAVDADGQTVTLLQRQYRDGVTDAADDAPVTIHFDPAEARALGLAF